MTALSGPDRDQLRQQLAEVLRREFGYTRSERDLRAEALLPVIADELDRIAAELNTPDQQIEIALSGADYVYDHLRTRAEALRTHEGDTDDPR